MFKENPSEVCFGQRGLKLRLRVQAEPGREKEQDYSDNRLTSRGVMCSGLGRDIEFFDFRLECLDEVFI